MSTDSIFTDAKRLADEKVYLSEDRYEAPKEYFKFTASMIKDIHGTDGRFALLDVGCATGEFIYHLRRRFANASFVGIDIYEPLVRRARERVDGIWFEPWSAAEAGDRFGRRFDVVTCLGVLSQSDDLTPALLGMLNALRPGGSMFIGTPTNEAPVDVIMRYRVNLPGQGEWERGRNTWSKHTYERLLRESGYGLQLSWHPFHMPFAIPRREDPMRNFTVPMADNPFQQINGACQIIDWQVLHVGVESLP